MPFGKFFRRLRNTLKSKASRPSNSYRPRLESLEDRRVPSWGFGVDPVARYLIGSGFSAAMISQSSASEVSINSERTAENSEVSETADHSEGGADHSGEDSLSATNLTQTHTYAAGTSSVALDPIVVSSEDTASTITATLTLKDASAGTLTATSGNGETYNATTGVWTISGSVTSVNKALAAVAFAPNAGNTADTSVAVNIQNGTGTTDGECGGESDEGLTGSIALNVTAASTGPTATNLTQTKTYSATDTSVALDPIVVSDANSSATITATLTLAAPTAGSLSATSGNGETYNSTTGVWTVTGSVTAVNSALAAVSFVPNGSSAVDTSIAVKIRDASGAGPDRTITLNLATSTSAPTATNLTQTKTFSAADTSVALDPIVVSDSNSAATIMATLTLASPTAGSLSATSGNSETYNSTTGVWTVSGSISSVNAALASVAFVPNVDSPVGTSVAVQIRDVSGAGPDGSIALNLSTAASAVTASGSSGVQGVSSTDSLTATNVSQTHTYTTDAANVALDPIVVSDTSAAATITASLTVANPTAGSLTAASGNGETYNATTGVWTVSGSIASVSAALAAVAFVPTASNAADTTIAVKITDDTSSSQGPCGESSGSVEGTITLNLTAAQAETVLTALLSPRR
jgi:hypothetical protein